MKKKLLFAAVAAAAGTAAYIITRKNLSDNDEDGYSHVFMIEMGDEKYQQLLEAAQEKDMEPLEYMLSLTEKNLRKREKRKEREEKTKKESE